MSGARPAAQWTIELTHECQATACAESNCLLCRNDTFKPCQQNGPGVKHLVKKPILAACGAVLTARVVCQTTNNVAQPTDVPPFQFQVCAVSYPQSLDTWAKLDDVALRTTTPTAKDKAGQQLLCVSSCDGCAPCVDVDGIITFPGHPAKGQALYAKPAGTPLPHLRVTQNTQKIHGCGGKAISLAIRAISEDNTVLDSQIAPIFSDAITIVSDKACKKSSHLHATDKIMVVEGIGGEMKKKLRRINEAVLKETQDQLKVKLDPELQSIVSPRVGDLQKIVEKVQPCTLSTRQLQKTLGMTAETWNRIVKLMQTMAFDDSRPRVWMFRHDSDTPDQGLIFGCIRGQVTCEASHIKGWVTRQRGREDFLPWHVAERQPAIRDAVLKKSGDREEGFLAQAALAFGLPKHPGWDIWRGDGNEPVVFPDAGSSYHVPFGYSDPCTNHDLGGFSPAPGTPPVPAASLNVFSSSDEVPVNTVPSSSIGTDDFPPRDIDVTMHDPDTWPNDHTTVDSTSERTLEATPNRYPSPLPLAPHSPGQVDHSMVNLRDVFPPAEAAAIGYVFSDGPITTNVNSSCEHSLNSPHNAVALPAPSQMRKRADCPTSGSLDSDDHWHNNWNSKMLCSGPPNARVARPPMQDLLTQHSVASSSSRPFPGGGSLQQQPSQHAVPTYHARPLTRTNVPQHDHERSRFPHHTPYPQHPQPQRDSSSPFIGLVCRARGSRSHSQTRRFSALQSTEDPAEGQYLPTVDAVCDRTRALTNYERSLLYAGDSLPIPHGPARKRPPGGFFNKILRWFGCGSSHKV